MKFREYPKMVDGIIYQNADEEKAAKKPRAKRATKKEVEEKREHSDKQS